MDRRTVLIRGGTAAVTALAGGSAVWYLTEPGRRPAEPSWGPGVIARAPVGGAFALRDQTGRDVTEASWPGKHLLIFFGFTNCPDVCPTAMADVADVLDRLGADAERVQPLLVTVDPERDTPEVLADYLRNFDPRIGALTGTPDQVAAMAKAWRVYYAKSPQGDGYAVDHSTFLYLMAPDGTNALTFSREVDTARVAEAIAAVLQG